MATSTTTTTPAQAIDFAALSAADFIRGTHNCGQHGHPRPWSEWAGNFACDYQGGLFDSWATECAARKLGLDGWAFNRAFFHTAEGKAFKARVHDLAKRYRRFRHHLLEVAPAWVDVQEIHYADNSVAMLQRARDGRTREVQTTGPWGDACF